mmetsp:Transcript_144578/g.254990  ORF Transcript_144578/g.254990 Transcript_144578/m.254990 type:complete len:117 (+) Transcript_144578:60-410(+)
MGKKKEDGGDSEGTSILSEDDEDADHVANKKEGSHAGAFMDESEEAPDDVDWGATERTSDHGDGEDDEEEEEDEEEAVSEEEDISSTLKDVVESEFGDEADGGGPLRQRRNAASKD